jgi:hypothetical protein
MFWGVRGGKGQRGEMAQTMYAHMNKWINKTINNVLGIHLEEHFSYSMQKAG